jgi:hypothetical protein
MIRRQVTAPVVIAGEFELVTSTKSLGNSQL